MAIMDQAVVQGQTVFFPQSIKRINTLSEGQTIAIPNGVGIYCFSYARFGYYWLLLH